VFPGLLRLALADLRSGWLKSAASLVLIGLGIIGVAYFASQAQRTETQIREAYEEDGAANFVVELSGLSDEELDHIVSAVRQLDSVSSADAPYNGVELGLQADTSFLVFENAQQKEYLGARVSVVGVDSFFHLRNGYYVDFGWLNPGAPRAVLGMPLLPDAGEFRPPQAGEILLPSTVTDYVGVQPGARAAIELIYANSSPPIVQRFDDLRLIGVFDTVGPDRGRIDPFWRLSYIGEPLLTARATGGTEATTVPVLLNVDLVRNFLREVESELRLDHSSPSGGPMRGQLVIEAASVAAVSATQNKVQSLLEAQGLKAAAENEQQRPRTFRVLLPERNNFLGVQREQRKIGTGAAYFASLVLLLLAAVTGGLQTLASLARWRDYGVLQAIGFSPWQILIVTSGTLLLVLVGSIALAAFIVMLTPGLAGSRDVFITAVVLSTAATIAGSIPVLLWPLRVQPVEMLKELQ
jgi:hypothetical protein